MATTFEAGTVASEQGVSLGFPLLNLDSRLKKFLLNDDWPECLLGIDLPEEYFLLPGEDENGQWPSIGEYLCRAMIHSLDTETGDQDGSGQISFYFKLHKDSYLEVLATGSFSGDGVQLTFRSTLLDKKPNIGCQYKNDTNL